VAGSKRARELARAKYERQQAARNARRAARRKKILITAGAIVAVVAVGAGVWVLWPEGSTSASPSASATPTSSTPPAPVPTPTGITCTEAGASTRTTTFPKAEPQKLKPGATLTLDTNCGKVVIEFAVANAPINTNAIAFLASKGFYTDAGCHRLTVEGIFVVQCGSPSNDGRGDAGFKLPDENLPKSGPNDYPTGTVAMANAGKGTASSQFFLVYKDSTLDPANYTVLGHITSGLDVIQYVAAKGVAPGSPSGQGDGPPAQPLVIKTATVRNG